MPSNSKAEASPKSPEFIKQLTELTPHLRAFAHSLCKDPVEADDLAQESLVKAWKARDSFQEGSNLKAWVFQILRNHFYSERRKLWRKSETSAEIADNMMPMNEGQSAALDLADLRSALKSLPDEQREALILVGAGGFSYDEAAEICGCALGTIKSRVNRARIALAELIESGAASGNRKSGKDAMSAADDIIAEAQSLAAEHG
ncbi:sigma-70 family RNA polymerase sigma factor [Hyphobacterium sp.]|jgi:RNA polymerase sigma-70 factor (ECF subfamily)|uniref:sigma-70 family RNA polymerase sigma factor n=1 Tax=Hyphobacterium sp. TaxID=2004662 RepID=UPI003BA8DC1E